MPRLNLAYERAYLTKPVKFNTISSYLEKETLTSTLLNLITRSSLPLSSIESIFAVDSTGFAGSRFTRWQDIKYRGASEHVWAKMHVMLGTRMHIVTAAVIKDRDASDLAQLSELLHITARNFIIREVVADAAYNTVQNQEVVAAIGAKAFFPFKSNHTGRRGGIWREQFSYWHENRDDFLEHYHQRSHVETGFMMIKSKFGDSLRSHKETAMKNEALAKVVAHNLYCLIQCMYHLRISTEFLAASFRKSTTDPSVLSP
jgi:transposase